MEPIRTARLHAMGLHDWQLRHPERLLGCPPTAETATPRLWVKGVVPGWITDLCLALGLAADGWSAWQTGAPTRWSLCTGDEPDPACALHCPLPADGDAKRRLWRAWCQQYV